MLIGKLNRYSLLTPTLHEYSVDHVYEQRTFFLPLFEERWIWIFVRFFGQIEIGDEMVSSWNQKAIAIKAQQVPVYRITQKSVVGPGGMRMFLYGFSLFG